MKQIFKYIGIFSLMIFSFYYTSYVANFLKSKTTLMQLINNNAGSKRVLATNAIINDKYIVPGINGLEVDAKKSYSNMLKVGFFDENYLVFNEIVPSISLKDNLDKIIKKGNNSKKMISIILDDPELLNYATKNNFKVNYLIDIDNIINNKQVELINNDVKNFSKIERVLDKNNQNKNICVLSENHNKEVCEAYGKYLVEPTYIINNSNLSSIVNEIDSGDIIKITNLNETNFIILINKIRYRNLKIGYLSELISEKYQAL